MIILMPSVSISINNVLMAHHKIFMVVFCQLKRSKVRQMTRQSFLNLTKNNVLLNSIQLW